MWRTCFAKVYNGRGKKSPWCLHQVRACFAALRDRQKRLIVGVGKASFGAVTRALSRFAKD